MLKYVPLNRTQRNNGCLFTLTLKNIDGYNDSGNQQLTAILNINFCFCSIISSAKKKGYSRNSQTIVKSLKMIVGFCNFCLLNKNESFESSVW